MINVEKLFIKRVNMKRFIESNLELTVQYNNCKDVMNGDLLKRRKVGVFIG
jgi:hypothetical protein